MSAIASSLMDAGIEELENFLSGGSRRNTPSPASDDVRLEATAQTSTRPSLRSVVTIPLSIASTGWTAGPIDQRLAATQTINSPMAAEEQSHVQWNESLLNIDDQKEAGLSDQRRHRRRSSRPTRRHRKHRRRSTSSSSPSSSSEREGSGWGREGRHRKLDDGVRRFQVSDPPLAGTQPRVTRFVALRRRGVIGHVAGFGSETF
jgi:hypothetical protein